MNNPYRYIRQGMFLLVILTLISACNGNADENSDKVFRMPGSGPEYNIQEANSILSTQWKDSAQVQKRLSERLSEPVAKYMFSFYHKQGLQLGWIEEDGLSEAGQQLLDALAKAEEEGLSSEDYRLQDLLQQKQKLDKGTMKAEDLVAYDEDLTTAYLQFAYHKLKGRFNPNRLDALWKTNRREKDLAAYLHTALKENELEESLESLSPTYREYEGLKKALAIYRELKKQQPEWPALPDDLVLKPGDSSRYVAQLRKRLRITGEYQGDTTATDTKDYRYDDDIKDAVAMYQFLNGLEVDSIVAGETIGMLNIPVDNRIKQILLNLERMRWMPYQPDNRYIRVNVPEYELYVYEGDKKALNMRVVVGEAYESHTPIFNDTMEYIAFSPTWTVPKSIIVNEMLPRIKRDPGYLTRSGYKLYHGWDASAPSIDPRSVNWNKADINEYRIVQQPGPGNALGMVKFMFPNNLAIYLHDTPSDHLFKNAERDYSHGCIRVERPTDLATYLLKDKGWTETDVEEHYRLPEPKNVSLTKKVPVMIEYRTAWLDEDGHVNFREDIYGHDKRQSELIESLLKDNKQLIGSVAAKED